MIRLFVYSFIRLFVYSFIRLFVYSFKDWFKFVRVQIDVAILWISIVGMRIHSCRPNITPIPGRGQKQPRTADLQGWVRGAGFKARGARFNVCVSHVSYIISRISKK